MFLYNKEEGLVCYVVDYDKKSHAKTLTKIYNNVILK